jgi:outer membrane protein TolC
MQRLRTNRVQRIPRIPRTSNSCSFRSVQRTSEEFFTVYTTRQQSQSVTDQVRQSYHQICILESQLIADDTQEKALEEALRIAENNVVQGIELEADKLQAKAALTQER